MTTQPRFHAGRAQSETVRVAWTPADVTKEDPIVELGRGTVAATCPPGIACAAGDLVEVVWVGRTLRITQLVAKAPTLPPAAPETTGGS